ncbi:MAG: nucleotidyltransferase domain-containing protein [Solirubrobacteraceae bacterium]
MTAGELAAQVPGATAGVMFGSWARGTATPPLSDLDLLVLVPDRSRVVAHFATTDAPRGLSVLIHDARTIGALCRADWSFVEHLRLENVPVFGDVERLRRLLRPDAPTEDVAREEIRRRADTHGGLSDPRALGGRHLIAYSRLYASVKSAAILDGVLASEPVFDRGAALAGAARRRPQIAEALASIEMLEPFWLRLRRRTHTPLPWSPRLDPVRLSRYALDARAVLAELASAP